MDGFTAQDGKRKKNLRIRGLFFLFFVAVLCHINTLKSGYVLDDNAVIVKNAIVTKGTAALPEIFTTPYLHGYISNPNDLYRPLSLAMFAIEYQLFGESPFVGHLVNVLIFAGCVLLVFFFVERLFGRQSIAFVTSGFFAVHPIHTEVVANIKSRDELLCFFFAMLAMLAFSRYCRDGKGAALAGGGGFFLLSLLSKETSITFLAVFPLIFCFVNSEERKRGIIVSLTALIAAGLFMLQRTAVLNGWHANHPFLVGVTENSLAAATTLSDRWATAVFILGKYLLLLFVPYPLVCDYSYNSIPLTHFTDVRVIISAIVYAVLFSICIYRFIRNRKDVWAFAIFFYLVTLSLFSNIFFLVGATMAERFLFFPSVGFCIFLGAASSKLILRPMPNKASSAKMQIILFLFAALACVYSVLLFSRNSDWADEPTLYAADLKHAPDNFRLYYYRGTQLINSAGGGTDSAAQKTLLEGIIYLKKSVTIYPGSQQTWAEIGSSYVQAGMFDSAIPYIKMAVAMKPEDTFSMNKLAAAYFKTGSYAASIGVCKKIIAIDTDNARAYRNIGACYLKMQLYDSAVGVLKIAIDIEPDAPTAYGFLAIAYSRLGVADSSRYEEIARRFNPNFRTR